MNKVTQLKTGYIPEDTVREDIEPLEHALKGEYQRRVDALTMINKARGHFDPVLKDITRVFDAFLKTIDILERELS